MHITEQEKYSFIRERVETPGITRLSPSNKIRILQRLIKAHQLEDFFAKKYPTEKRFGLEGGEVVIPGLKALIDTACSFGVEKFNIGNINVSFIKQGVK